jgi:monoamine oxidase
LAPLRQNGVFQASEVSYLSVPYKPKHKVGVIGAGLAGLTFAHHVRLNYPDVEVSIFEGRDRLGGRVNTLRREHLNAPILEGGAEFINEDHSEIRNLCQHLEINLIPTYSGDDAAPSFAAIDGRIVREDFRGLIRDLREAILQDRAKLHDDIQRIAFASMSAADYISNLGLSGTDSELLNLFVHTEQAVKPGKMSALFLLEWMDFETFPEGHNTLFAAGDDKYRIEGGSSALVNALAKPLHNQIEVGEPVSGIFETTGGYRVYTNKIAPKSFDSVVVAFPATKAKEINFGGADLIDFQRRMNKFRYSEVAKTIISVNGELPSLLQEYHQILDLNLKGLMWGTGQSPIPTPGRSWIAVYRGGENIGYTKGHRNSQDMIKEAIRNISTASSLQNPTRLPDPSVADIETIHYVEGGFNMPTIGRGADFARKTLSNYGRLFPAGEHLALKDPETMAGAVESGLNTYRHWVNLVFPSNRLLKILGE